jgi:hypothetical protein
VDKDKNEKRSIVRQLVEKDPYYLSEAFTKWQALYDLRILSKCGKVDQKSKFFELRWRWSRCKIKRFFHQLEELGAIVNRGKGMLIVNGRLVEKNNKFLMLTDYLTKGGDHD